MNNHIIRLKNKPYSPYILVFDLCVNGAVSIFERSDGPNLGTFLFSSSFITDTRIHLFIPIPPIY